MSLEFPFYPFVPDSTQQQQCFQASQFSRPWLGNLRSHCCQGGKIARLLFTPFFPGLDAVFIAIFGTSRVQSVTFYPNIDFFFTRFNPHSFFEHKGSQFLKDKAKKISEFCLQDFCTSIWRPPKRYFLSPHFQLSTLNSGKILRLHVYRFHFLSFHGVWHGSTA